MDTDQAATNQKPPTENFQIQQPPHDATSSTPLKKIITVTSIAAGIQFGWALQLSLLTPYVQLLGIPHAWASFIWLCGPISGLLVQPIVGHFSDRCTSRFGRRRPFIAAGTTSVTIAVFLIGYAADLGHLFGDSINSKVKRILLWSIWYYELFLLFNGSSRFGFNLIVHSMSISGKNTSYCGFCCWVLDS